MLLVRCARRFLPLLLLVGQESDPTTPPGDALEPTLEVRALANEGFLLSAGDAAVLIDAFVSEPYSIYGALSGEALEQLLGAEGPFASVDIALTSHQHGDHFQAEPARCFLAARRDCTFVSSPQVVEALLGVPEGVHPRSIGSLLPSPGEECLFEQDGIRVEFLRLSHGSGRFAKIHNLGHVITLGGVTALHVGDAAMVGANFAAYALEQRGIDVVFVPYWYFDDADGRRIVDEHFSPARLVACHIPPSELESVSRRMAEQHPQVLVPQAPLELLRFRDENAARR